MIDCLDRDIPISKWNSYLKKYADKYLLNCGDLGNWEIRLKENLGFIELYSLVKRQLVAILTFRSGKHKTFFKKRLVGNIENMVKITQEGEYELCLMFDEDNIKQLEFLLKIRKRFKISQKEREKRIERLKKARLVKTGGIIEVAMRKHD
jgi:hypothetical protein